MIQEVVDATQGVSATFRRRALALVAQRRQLAEVARLLEVSDQTIYTWPRQALIDRGELLESGFAVHRRAAELLKEEVRPKGVSRRSS